MFDVCRHWSSPSRQYALRVRPRRHCGGALKPPYITRYPELAHLFEENPNYPRRNIVQDNLSVRSGDFGTGSNDVQGTWVTDEDPGFMDAANMNFQLKPDSPVWTKVPGFQRIPFERIGLYTDECRKALPVHPTDCDHDGMPDAWEKAHGLDPNNSADGAAVAANGCTDVENYLNELAGDPIPGP